MACKEKCLTHTNRSLVAAAYLYLGQEVSRVCSCELLCLGVEVFKANFRAIHVYYIDVCVSKSQ